MKQIFFFILDLLSYRLRRFFTLRSLNISYSEVEYKDIYFKIAESQKEIFQALELVQNEYQKKGLLSGSNSQIRITKYNLIPSTIIFVAKDSNTDNVVGTASLISDSH